MNLEKLIESHFAPKKGNDLLIKLIESKLNEDLGIPMPEVTPGVGAAGESFREEWREVLSEPLKRATGEKIHISERLAIINDYLYRRIDTKDMRMDEFIAVFAFLQEFEKLIREYADYDERLAGHKFESLMTVFLDGVQELGVQINDATVSGDLVSMKFIKDQSTPAIDGSLYNLIKDMSEGKRIIYLTCLKSAPNYFFHTFAVDATNFFISIMKGGKFKKFFYDGDSPIILTEDLIPSGFTYFKPGDSFDIGTEKFYKDYKSGAVSGTSLASMMIKIMEKRYPNSYLDTTRLFDQYVLMEIFSGPKKGVTETGIRHQFEGVLQLNQKILQESVMSYRREIYGGVLNLLKATENLAKNFRDFFAGNSFAKEGEEILDDIEEIDGLFQYISGVRR